MSQISVQIHYPAFAWNLCLTRQDVHKAMVEMLMALGTRGLDIPNEVELHMHDDAAIAAFNHNFMGCKGPTNILSFPSDMHGLPATLLLSLDTLERERHLYGQTSESHLLHLLAHGLCHLSGLDHGEEMDFYTDICLKGINERLLEFLQ